MSYYIIKTSKKIIKAIKIVSLILVCLLQVVCGHNKKVDRLIAIVNSNDLKPDIRCNAVKTLGEIKDARAIEPLMAALKDENETVRYATEEALSKIGAPALKPLIAAMTDTSKYFLSEQSSMVLCMYLRICGPPEGIKPHDFYTQRNKYISKLIKGIKILDDSDLQYLISALQHEDWSVRQVSVRMLGLKKDTRAFGPLLDALKIEDTSPVSDEIINALGNFGKPAIQAISDALNDANPDVRKNITKALGSMNNDCAVELLNSALKDKDVSVRVSAVYAISNKDDTCAVKALKAVLDHEDWAVIKKASGCFIAWGISGSEPVLIKALNQPSKEPSNADEYDMAIDFLNSGNWQLENAAREWAEKHGYSITNTPATSFGNPKWGK